MRLTARLFAGALLFVSCASAQFLSLGIKGGVPFTDAFNNHTVLGVDTNTHSFTADKNYVIGPMVEFHLPLGFSVEADALYRPLNLRQDFSSLSLQTMTHSSTNLNSWEFPILVKYHLGLPVVKPYVEAGPSFRTVRDIGSLSHAGATLGAGLDFKAGRFHFGPELRYTRWSADGTKLSSYANVPSNLNQTEFLIGFTF